MTDEQVYRRLASKRMLIISAILIILGGALIYFKVYETPILNNYNSEKSQESSLQSQIDQLTQTNSSLTSTIEESGKNLVSFSEDKILYINLASELAEKYSVDINKLSVSDVWSEGQMSVMTTNLEVQGNLEQVRGFINDYCGINYTNRITQVSCRPVGRYPWMTRSLDGEKVLQWFNLDGEDEIYTNQLEEEFRQMNQELVDQGQTPLEEPDDTEIQKAITLDEMFAPFTFKLYLQVDFLGRP